MGSIDQKHVCAIEAVSAAIRGRTAAAHPTPRSARTVFAEFLRVVSERLRSFVHERVRQRDPTILSKLLISSILLLPGRYAFKLGAFSASYGYPWTANTYCQLRSFLPSRRTDYRSKLLRAIYLTRLYQANAVSHILTDGMSFHAELDQLRSDLGLPGKPYRSFLDSINRTDNAQPSAAGDSAHLIEPDLVSTQVDWAVAYRQWQQVLCDDRSSYETFAGCMVLCIDLHQLSSARSILAEHGQRFGDARVEDWNRFLDSDGSTPFSLRKYTCFFPDRDTEIHQLFTLRARSCMANELVEPLINLMWRYVPSPCASEYGAYIADGSIPYERFRHLKEEKLNFIRPSDLAGIVRFVFDSGRITESLNYLLGIIFATPEKRDVCHYSGLVASLEAAIRGSGSPVLNAGESNGQSRAIREDHDIYGSDVCALTGIQAAKEIVELDIANHLWRLQVCCDNDELRPKALVLCRKYFLKRDPTENLFEVIRYGSTVNDPTTVENSRVLHAFRRIFYKAELANMEFPLFQKNDGTALYRRMRRKLEDVGYDPGRGCVVYSNHLSNLTAIPAALCDTGLPQVTLVKRALTGEIEEHHRSLQGLTVYDKSQVYGARFFLEAVKVLSRGGFVHLVADRDVSGGDEAGSNTLVLFHDGARRIPSSPGHLASTTNSQLMHIDPLSADDGQIDFFVRNLTVPGGGSGALRTQLYMQGISASVRGFHSLHPEAFPVKKRRARYRRSLHRLDSNLRHGVYDVLKQEAWSSKTAYVSDQEQVAYAELASLSLKSARCVLQCQAAEKFSRSVNRNPYRVAVAISPGVSALSLLLGAFCSGSDATFMDPGCSQELLLEMLLEFRPDLVFTNSESFDSIQQAGKLSGHVFVVADEGGVPHLSNLLSDVAESEWLSSIDASVPALVVFVSDRGGVADKVTIPVDRLCRTHEPSFEGLAPAVGEASMMGTWGDGSVALVLEQTLTGAGYRRCSEGSDMDSPRAAWKR